MNVNVAELYHLPVRSNHSLWASWPRSSVGWPSLGHAYYIYSIFLHFTLSKEIIFFDLTRGWRFYLKLLLD